MGAGQSVTVLYELDAAAGKGPLGQVSIAYKLPAEDSPHSLISQLPGQVQTFEQSSPDHHLAAAAAAFAMQLSDSKFKGEAGFEEVLLWAAASLASGHIKQRYELFRLAQAQARIAPDDFDIVGHDGRHSVSFFSQQERHGLGGKPPGIYRLQSGQPAKLVAPIHPMALRHPDLPPAFWDRAVATVDVELDYSKPETPEPKRPSLFP